MKLFEIIPDRLFNILTGENKEIYADCLYLIYDYMNTKSSFSTYKDDIVEELTMYFINHQANLEEELNNTPKDKANYVLRRLRSTGWIDEDIGKNYQLIITIQDYASQIIETFMNLNSESDVKYSSYVYQIYRTFKEFEYQDGNLSIEEAYNNTKSLINELKILNSNIKKYINQVTFEDKNKSLDDLLNFCLNEYQVKIVSNAFYNLTTHDNPAKYKNYIINGIDQILRDEDGMKVIVNSSMKRSDKSSVETYDYIENQLYFIKNSFYELEDIIDEISNKNTRFTESAVNRIHYLLNNKQDITGKIDQIIKQIYEYDLSLDMNFYPNKYLNNDSMYKRRKKTIITKPTLEISNKDDLKITEEMFEKYRQASKYSQKNINSFILNEVLNYQSSIKASEISLDNDDIKIKIILAFLYGYSNNPAYEIVSLDQYIVHNGIMFKDFIIRRKTNG